jgi:S-DNA-T family DNA segregation ATPase FtsK/SpoIIIE
LDQGGYEQLTKIAARNHPLPRNMAQVDNAASHRRNIIKRDARKREPLPQAEVKFRQPKSFPPPPSKPNLLSMLPTIFMSLSTGIIAYFVSEGRGGRAVITVIPMLLMGFMMVGIQQWTYRSAVKKHTGEVKELQDKYEGYLAETARELHQYAETQRRILLQENPSIELLIRRVQKRVSTLWERQPGDNDFLSLRIGSGTLPISVTIKKPDGDDEDPRVRQAMQLAEQYSWVHHLPITTNIAKLGSLGVRGQRQNEALYLAYALVANITVLHSPDEVHLYVLSHRQDAAERWGWLRWLPHTHVLHSKQSCLSFKPHTDEPVLVELSQLLRRRSDERPQANLAFGQSEPHLVIIFDNVLSELQTHMVVQMLLAHSPEQERNKLRASAIFIENPIPSQVNAVITVNGSNLEYWETWASDANQIRQRGAVELANLEQMKQLARSMAPLLTEASYSADGGGLPSSVRLIELLDVTQLHEINLSQLYSDHYDPKKVMAFPVGLNVDSKPLQLILREKGQDGHGAHAMLAGMTGTGKSVLLQAIVLSLALTNSPAHLNFVLADFKGGASELAKLQGLPHVVGFVTDLNTAMVERFRIALESEVFRRKNLFDSAKEKLGAPVANIRTYNKLRPDDPLPHLVILLDEFAHGVQINPNFRGTMDTIAAQGRALGVHLILSTQRAADFDNKIRPNIEIRISLRVASTEDSRTMFNRPEAYSRLQRPGQAYVQVGDNEIFDMFQAARADTPYIPNGALDLNQLDNFTLYQVLADGRRKELYQHKKGEGQVEKPAQPTLTEAEVLVEYINSHCRPKYKAARLICLPPLPEPAHYPLLPLIQQEQPFCRWQDDHWSEQKITSQRLKVPLGLLDLPAHQEQQPFILDLNRRDGNFLVVGPLGSGKSLFLRTLLLGLAATHSPADVHIYVLSRGPALAVFEQLPHCGALIRPIEKERTTRLFQFLREEITRRREWMRRAKVEGMAALRAAQPGTPLPALVLVLEDFAGFRAENEELLEEIQRLAGDGKAVDIHLILSSNALGSVHFKTQENLRNRLALGLKSAADHIDLLGKRAEVLPEIPGRGYVNAEQDVLECQIAAPASQPGEPDSPQAAQALQTLVQTMNEAWQGPRPQPILELSKYIELQGLWQATPSSTPHPYELATAPLGLNYEQLAPVALDFIKVEPIALVVGPAESGKTDFLLTLCLSACKNLLPRQIELYIFSLKSQRLRPLGGLPHVQYAGNASHSRKLLNSLLESLKVRAEEQRAKQEATQEWTTSDLSRSIIKRTVIIIDDLQSFLRADAEFVKLVDQCFTVGADVGIHIILADTGHNLNQAKQQSMGIKFLQAAFQFGCGVSFSLEQTDLACLGLQFKVKAPQVQLHSPHFGKGRGYLAYQNRESVVQFARWGSAEEEERSLSTRLKELVSGLAAEYQPAEPAAVPVSEP